MEMKAFVKQVREDGKVDLILQNIEAVPEDEWVTVPDTHEAIIDKATFEKVQALLKRDTRTCLLYTSPEEIAALQRDYAALWGPLSDLLKKLSALVEL